MFEVFAEHIFKVRVMFNIDFLIDVKELRDRVKQLDRKNFKYPFELKLSTFPNVKLKYIYPRISEESYFISDNDTLMCEELLCE